MCEFQKIMEKLAIIGTGIAGMGCGYFLHRKYDITYFEQLNYVGGHTNTIYVEEEGKQIPIDTGFIVFNHVTYPNLIRLFDEIKAPTKKSDMSFSVQHVPSKLEFAGTGLNGLFAQRKNIFKPSYIRFLLDINKFNEEAPKILDNSKYQNHTLKQFVDELGLGQDFWDKFLVPMSSAVWSTPPDLMLGFPAVSLIRFFKNHGFLGLNSQHQWYTVDGGSESYKKLLIAPFKDKIQINKGVKKVYRENGKVRISTWDGSELIFDKVIFAAHADQTLKMLGDPTTEEIRLLSPFKYQPNKATLHTDDYAMPKTKLSWAAWNYRVEKDKSGETKPSTIYWMNRLQGVSKKKNYFVSINDAGGIDSNKIIKEIEYEHPLFTVETATAQKELFKLNQNKISFFAGSYFRYGFHEDAFMSAVECSRAVDADCVWK